MVIANTNPSGRKEESAETPYNFLPGNLKRLFLYSWNGLFPYLL